MPLDIATLENRYPRPDGDKSLDLMPKWLEDLFLQKQEGVDEPDYYDGVVLAHYFFGSYDFLATGYDPENRILYGFASFSGLRSIDAEYGTVFLDELSNTRIAPLGFRIERETWSFKVGLGVKEWVEKAT